MSEARLMLLRNWSDLEMCSVLVDIRQCTFKLGEELTREQANELEKIRAIFDRPPSPTVAGVVRSHFPIKYVWRKVYRFILLHPMFGSGTIVGIMPNFGIMADMENEQ
jgi:hypothetical protein